MSLPMYIAKESPRDKYASSFSSSTLGSVCLGQVAVDETYSVTHADRSIDRSAVVLHCLVAPYLSDIQLFTPPPPENGRDYYTSTL